MRKILNLILSFAMISTLIPTAGTIFAANESSENLALHKTATASASESSAGTTLSADKAVDGVTNRDETAYAKTSRWGTPQLTGQAAWLKVDLGEQKTFQSFVIEWEKSNITAYTIDVLQEDGTWTAVYTKPGTDRITSVEEVIHLDQPVSGQQVRLNITGYEDAVAGWKSISVFEFQIYEANVPDEVLTNENLALAKEAKASDAESSAGVSTSADKAFDGIINRGEPFKTSSRWGTNQLSGQPAWLSVDLGSVQYLRSFLIEWERTNITGFQIQVSNTGADDTWTTVYTKEGTDEIANVSSRIELDKAVHGRYVRLYVDGYTGGTLNYKSVSVYEFQMFATTLDGLKPTLENVAAAITAPTVQKGDATLKLPSVPEGFSVSINGVDYEQIIDVDGTIYQPLVSSDVVMKLDVTDGEKTVTTGELTVTVPGKVDDPITENKPSVIPELREWAGEEGNFSISDTSKIVVNPASADALKETTKEFQADYKDIIGKDIEIVEGTTPGATDFYFTLDTADKGLKEEGYVINVTEEAVSVEAMEAKGAYWATRTILQILKQSGSSIPCGVTRDYPKFELRGFMFDVGRLPFTLDFVKEIEKNMAWYKLNDLQLHLNDNYIWIEEYENPIRDAYSGFRLESDIVGENGVKLTSEDMYYTKDEFRSFIKESRNIGINVVPEFDTPAHSLALTKVRPDLAMQDTSVARHFDHLDLNTKYDESLAFVQDIFNEYLTGENPVFDEDTIVNVGTDEYDGKYAEQFRKYTDDMLKFIQDDHNRTVRLWGSLSARSGSTPVRSEGVQMNIWNNGWANPTAMLNQGYDLINMNDSTLYMVPSGSGNVGGYGDYINAQNLYNSWKPNVIGGVTISSTSPQMLGAAYAMWNDNTDKRTKGLASTDFFTRFYHPLASLSEKMWGEGRDKTFAELEALKAKTSTAPNTNPFYEVDSKTDTVVDYDCETINMVDASGNDYHAINTMNVGNGEGRNGGNGLKFNGGESYVETPVQNMGPKSTFSFSIKKTAVDSKEEQILFESEIGNIKIQKDTGKLGFSRLGNDFSFEYIVPDGKWIDVELRAGDQKTDLLVNGKMVDSISLNSSTTAKVGTLIVPLERIGGKEHAFIGLMDNIKLVKGAETYVDPYLIPTTDFIVSANNAEQDHSGTEGPIALAFDGKNNTIWHTQYSPSQKVVNEANPAIVSIDMAEVYNIDRFTYVPRQSGDNGNITKYELWGKEKESDEYTLLSSGTWDVNGNAKAVTFDAVNVRYLQFKALAGKGNFASAAEFNVFKAEEAEEMDLAGLVAEAKAIDTTGYTADSVKALMDEIDAAQAVLDNEDATATEINAAYAALQDAINGLKKTADYTAANKLLAEINAMRLEDTFYTANSWKAFDDAYKPVVDMVNQKDADQETLDAACAALDSAVKGLIKKATDGMIKNLETAIADLESYRKDYTELEFANAAAAIDAAKAVLADVNADPANAEFTVVADAASALAMAKDGLKHNVELESLRVLVASANKVLDSDEIDDVRPGKVQALKDAIAAAESLIEANSTNDAAIKAASKNLLKALQELYKIVDRNDLMGLIANAKTLTKDLYTADSWNALTTALAAAEAVNDDATKDEVDTAYDALVSAVASLELKVNKEALKMQLDIAEKVKANIKNYVASTVLGLEDVIKSAQAVYDDANATQKEVENATNSLITALAKARLKADKTVLENEVAKVKAMNYKLYTTGSVEDIKAALAKAEQALKDPEATQEAVNEALNDLQKAVSSAKKVNANNPTNSNNSVNNGSNTGDTTNLMPFIVLMIIGGAAVVFLVIRKRKAVKK